MNSLCLCLLLLATDTPPPVPISVPAAVTAEVGDLFNITATTDGAAVKFISLSPSVKLIPAGVLKDGKCAWGAGKLPGVYQVMAYSVVNGVLTDPVYTTVTITTPAPPPPPPDPLAGALQAAYSAESDPAKAAKVAYLASVFKMVDLTGLATNDDLGLLLKTAVENPNGIPSGQLPKLMALILGELSKALPAGAALDAAKAKAELTKLSTLLGGLK